MVKKDTGSRNFTTFEDVGLGVMPQFLSSFLECFFFACSFVHLIKQIQPAFEKCILSRDFKIRLGCILIIINDAESFFSVSDFYGVAQASYSKHFLQFFQVRLPNRTSHSVLYQFSFTMQKFAFVSTAFARNSRKEKLNSNNIGLKRAQAI